MINRLQFLLTIPDFNGHIIISLFSWVALHIIIINLFRTLTLIYINKLVLKLINVFLLDRCTTDLLPWVDLALTHNIHYHSNFHIIGHLIIFTAWTTLGFNRNITVMAALRIGLFRNTYSPIYPYYISYKIQIIN